MLGGRVDKPDPFHPATVLRRWDKDAFTLEDATTGVCVFGGTGSGKTSGPAKHLALAYMARQFGGLVLCSKKEERGMWETWAAEASRSKDLAIFDASGTFRFNFMEWEAQRPGEGAGLGINIVSMLDEIAAAVTGGSGDAAGEAGDNNKFFTDALHHLNANAVDLAIAARTPLTLPFLRSLINSAPRSLQEAQDPQWQKESDCWVALEEAEELTRGADEDTRATVKECRQYFLNEFSGLNERTRSIILLYFAMLVRPFLTKPLRSLFATTTNLQPEDAFDGKIIVVDVPVQEYRLVGRLANLAWKYCMQIAVMRRARGGREQRLRPIFIWADEAQQFVSSFDAEYQAVARSGAGCTVYITQNRESYRRVLQDDDAVDSLLGNLQCKVFCQNSSVDTNEWAAKLLGQNWVGVVSTSTNRQGPEPNGTSGVSRSDQYRYRVEPGEFTVLRRGGVHHDHRIDAIVYNGGKVFDGGKSFRVLTFDQTR